MMGNIHSIQTMGTLDGPGVRFVVFMQGCPLRCKCCHNPDTWDFSGGIEYTPEELVKKALRYRAYFGETGGITASGGEPLCQAAFVEKLFSLCHEEKLNTCLDTSGQVLTEEIKKLLAVTDRVLLDIKYTEDELYRAHVGCSMEMPMAFLDYLQEIKMPTTLRQVIIPGINDGEEQIEKLKEIAVAHPCVDKIELLPFRKICQTKYDQMGIAFPFEHIPEPTRENMAKLEAIIEAYL